MDLKKLLDELEGDLDDRIAETRAAEIVNQVSPAMARLGHAHLVREWTPAAGPIEVRRYLAECIAATTPVPEPVREKLLTPPQVAEQLGSDPATIINWIRSGQHRASNLATGSRPRFVIQPSDLDAFLRARQPDLRKRKLT
jgi:hypothetical protein